MLQHQNNKNQKTIRRTFEPTRIAEAMLEQAYGHLVPQTVCVIERNNENVGKAKAQAR